MYEFKTHFGRLRWAMDNWYQIIIFLYEGMIRIRMYTIFNDQHRHSAGGRTGRGIRGNISQQTVILYYYITFA